MKALLTETITNFYLNSNDFNGIHIGLLQEKLDKRWKEIQIPLQELIESDNVRIIDEKSDSNPHVIRLGFESIDLQVSKVKCDIPGNICLYPSKKVLETILPLDTFRNEPYKLRLALGDAQLEYVSFELSILEYYRNDPRYRYKNDDIRGQIYSDNDDLTEKDKVILQTFGFSYDDDLNRAISVFLRYLVHLSPEQQQIWKTKELPNNFKLHPDYYRSAIEGNWGTGLPICQAFLRELYTINKISLIIGRPTFFKNTYGEYGEEGPKNFHFLIRPTSEEFNSFVLLFDKMISDNINIDFFMNDVEYENETTHEDGKIIVSKKGTLQLLDEWIHKVYQFENWAAWNNSFNALKKVRKLRQKPAHAISKDIFDQKYFKEQRELIRDAYKAISLIRQVLSEHPNVIHSDFKLPQWLSEGKIWNV